jgi:hypothetical protein
VTSAITACVAALHLLVWPHLERWKGLPDDCKLSDVGAVFHLPPDAWWGGGEIGEDLRLRAWVDASGDAFPAAIQVWHDGDRAWREGDRVILLETPLEGSRADLASLLRRLGRPAAKLDAFFGIFMPGSEWVYPALGLTLYVNPETQRPLRVAVYRPTTLADYRKRLRPITRPKSRDF